MRPNFTLCIQDATVQKVTVINPGLPDKFVTVNLGGDGVDVTAEIFVRNRAEAAEFIAAFQEAYNLLPEDG